MSSAVGRPTLHAHNAITVRLTTKQYKKLMTIALRKGQKMNAIIRGLVERAK